jgi:hypothetical protein
VTWSHLRVPPPVVCFFLLAYFTYFFFFVIWVKYTNFLFKDMHGCQNRFGSDTDGEFGTPQGIEQLVAV